MNKTCVIILSLTLLLGFVSINNLMAEDDPLAGMDAGDDPFAGMDMGAAPDSGADPMAGMDAGADDSGMEAGVDVLFPDSGPDVPGVDTGAGAGTAGLPGEPGMDAGMEGMPGEGGEGPDLGSMGMGDMGAGPDMGSMQAPAATGAPQIPAAKPKRKAKPKKTGPTTKKSNPKTDDIYTKSNYIGGYRHLHDIMSWGLAATSRLAEDNDVSKIDDNLVDTAWVEGKKDGGKKQVITFKFDEKYFIGLYEKKYRRVQIEKIRILNGWATDKQTWEKYFRVKKLKVTLNKKTVFYMILHDTMNWQTITLKKPLVIRPGDKLKAYIQEVFPERRREDYTYAAITEFTFIGGPNGRKVEPKYIEAHMQ